MNPSNERPDLSKTGAADSDAQRDSAAEALRKDSEMRGPQHADSYPERNTTGSAGSPHGPGGNESVALPGLPEFSSKAFELFPVLDLDNNGRIEDLELDQAMLDPQLKGWKAQIVAGLRVAMDSIKELADDNPHYSDPALARAMRARPPADPFLQPGEEVGITEADLKAFEERRSGVEDAQRKVQDVYNWNRKNFDYADTDGDGFLKPQEINPFTSGVRQYPGVMNFLHENFSEIREYSSEEDKHWTGLLNGIRRQDIEKMYKDAFQGPVSQMFGNIERAMESAGKARGTSAPGELFNYSRTDGGIVPDAVKPGALHNGPFHAVVAALASSPEGRRQLGKMVSSTPDGTYSVTFPCDPSKPITVARPTAQEMGAYNAYSPEFGIWPCVLEKAFREYSQIPKPANQSMKESAQEDRGELAFETLTGSAPKKLSLDQLRLSEIGSRLTTAMRNGHAVTGAATRNSEINLSEQTCGIVGFNPDGSGGGTVKIREFGPSTAPSDPDKQKSMSLKDFLERFKHIYIESR